MVLTCDQTYSFFSELKEKHAMHNMIVPSADKQALKMFITLAEISCNRHTEKTGQGPHKQVSMKQSACSTGRDIQVEHFNLIFWTLIAIDIISLPSICLEPNQDKNSFFQPRYLFSHAKNNYTVPTTR